MKIVKPTSLLLCAIASTALAAAAASASDFPVSTYEARGFTLAFDGNGHFRVSHKTTVGVEGDYSVSGDQLTFKDASGPWACPKDQGGTYQWDAKGGTLSLKKVSDSCNDRVTDLTASAWTQQAGS